MLLNMRVVSLVSVCAVQDISHIFFQKSFAAHLLTQMLTQSILRLFVDEENKSSCNSDKTQVIKTRLHQGFHYIYNNILV